ncbi:MAG: hypothetical protein M3O70_06285 [Actinomycetota bacterium]|nr:hypothetical protein [Actinomycetota bacterium]
MADAGVGFGRLEQVDVRHGWAYEDREFTPWLAANLDRLSEALGIPLVLVEQEHQVGRFSLDLLVDSDGHRVVIENQFGTADHKHLGQLLTYAAGTEAQIVVWLAETFYEEHLAALEWLNESTLAETGFFAVELKLMKIGNSPLAPLFKVVARPNNWRKSSRQHTEQVAEEWSFEAYENVLNVDPERVELCRRIHDELTAEIERRDLDWSVRFNKGYVAFFRSGGYNVITLWPHGYADPRLHVKLPEPLEELGTDDPFPGLHRDWIDAWREQTWDLVAPHPSPAEIARGAVELAQKWTPTKGSLPPRRSADQ